MAYIPLTVRESDGSPSATVRELIVSNGSETTGATFGSVTVVTGAGSTAGGTLTVAESDGSPSVASVTKLVASTSFTVTDNSSGQVTLALGASSGSAGAMTLIQDLVSTGSTGPFTFSAIPGTYKALHLNLHARSDGSAMITTVQIRFNGSTAAEYDYMLVEAASTAGVGITRANAVAFGILGSGVDNSAPAGSAAIASADIPNYASTVFHKQAVSHAGARYNTSANVNDTVLTNWRQTAAITQIDVFPDAGSFIAGSRATLWGKG